MPHQRYIPCAIWRNSILTNIPSNIPTQRLYLRRNSAANRAFLRHFCASTASPTRSKWSLSTQLAIATTKPSIGTGCRGELEALCSRVLSAHRCFAFTSGGAAVSAVTRLLHPSDSILASKDLPPQLQGLLVYSPPRVKFSETWDRSKLSYDLANTPRVKLVYVFSPSYTHLHMTELPVDLEGDPLVCLDASLLPPAGNNPQEIYIDADVILYSSTTLLSGREDLSAGIVACRSVELAERLGLIQSYEGTALGETDAKEMLIGMGTLALRSSATKSNAAEARRFLRGHPGVRWVKGSGGLVSFEVGSPAVAEGVMRHVKVLRSGGEMGGCRSVVEAAGGDSAIVRMWVGTEAAVDLLHDLENAVSSAVAEVGEEPGLGRRLGLGSQVLGESLPPKDPHAVGVSMPQWADVVAYEEGCQEVHEKLSAGYPRFVFLKSVTKLFKKAEDLFARPGEAAMVFPSARVALRLQQFLQKQGVEQVDIHDFFAHGAFAVTFPVDAANHAKAFWQHTGEVISSRFAEAVLSVIEKTCEENAEKHVPEAILSEFDTEGSDVYLELRERLATLCVQDKNSVFLYPTGMAALTATHRLLQLSSQWEDAPLRTIVFGFPYLDTLKLSELSTGCLFFGRGDSQDLAALETALQAERFGGIFCEFASNPLLISPDLAKIRAIADRYKVPVICDNTVSFPNVQVLRPGGADVGITSLTKQFSGSGNVMGGALVLNAHSTHYNKHLARLKRDHEELLWAEDARVLLDGSQDFCMRTAKANASAKRLVELLQNHPLVKAVYHPSIMTPELYNEWRSDAYYAGGGALLSVVLQTPEQCERFYDALDVAKGPGFGTNFTLACPYTVIAHFRELEWAERYGVDPNLVRDMDRPRGVRGSRVQSN